MDVAPTVVVPRGGPWPSPVRNETRDEKSAINYQTAAPCSDSRIVSAFGWLIAQRRCESMAL